MKAGTKCPPNLTRGSAAGLRGLLTGHCAAECRRMRTYVGGRPHRHTWGCRHNFQHRESAPQGDGTGTGGDGRDTRGDHPRWANWPVTAIHRHYSWTITGRLASGPHRPPPPRQVMRVPPLAP